MAARLAEYLNFQDVKVHKVPCNISLALVTFNDAEALVTAERRGTPWLKANLAEPQPHLCQLGLVTNELSESDPYQIAYVQY